MSEVHESMFRDDDNIALIPDEHYQVSFHLDETKERTDEQEALLDEVEHFADKISMRFGRCVLDWLTNVSHIENSGVSDKVVNFIRTHGLYMPSFSSYDRTTAPEAASALGLSELSLNDDELMMVFNLPKPLSQYWWKGGVAGTRKIEDKDIQPQENPKEDELAQEERNFTEDTNTRTAPEKVGPGILNWGSAFRKSHSIFWEELGYQYTEGELRFSRINPNRKHNPRKYYYVFKVHAEKLPEQEEQTNVGAALQAALSKLP